MTRLPGAMLVLVLLGAVVCAVKAESFDHTPFDRIVRKHVDADGWVDYKALKQNADALHAYTKALASVKPAELPKNERLALLINAYNAFTLELIVEHYPLKSITDIPEAKRWDAVRWNIGGKRYGLNQIEHELIRKPFKEPRIHFALVCAAVGCPPLRNEAYTGAKLDEQLTAQTLYCHAHVRWFRDDRARNTVYLTKLYEWYAEDFVKAAGSVLAFAARYTEHKLTEGRPTPTVKYLPYDWKLNDVTNRPK